MKVGNLVRCRKTGHIGCVVDVFDTRRDERPYVFAYFSEFGKQVVFLDNGWEVISASR